MKMFFRFSEPPGFSETPEVPFLFFHNFILISHFHTKHIFLCNSKFTAPNIFLFLFS